MVLQGAAILLYDLAQYESGLKNNDFTGVQRVCTK